MAVKGHFLIRLMGLTGLLAAGIFLCAILFQTMSSFIIPQCHV